MDIFKFGVIGFIILLPFLFINVITGDTYRYRERTAEYIRDQVEEASRDAAFAMKTYSEDGYDSNDVYSIQVPFASVTDTFFTSLKYREFRYEADDFVALIYMGYNQVVIYHPDTRNYSRPYYYLNESGTLYTMGNQTYTMTRDHIEMTDDVIEPNSPKADRRSRTIYTTFQEAVSREIPSYTVQTGVYEDSFGTDVADDLSFIVLYDGASDYGLGHMRIQTFTPSGIMKSEIDY